jgi:hypothetical protein
MGSVSANTAENQGHPRGGWNWSSLSRRERDEFVFHLVLMVLETASAVWVAAAALWRR